MVAFVFVCTGGGGGLDPHRRFQCIARPMATQGIQAQTIANFWLAFAADMTIIPVVNKIDLPTADVAAVEAEITETLELPLSDVCYVSAKVCHL